MLLRSAPRSICINHTLVDDVHSSLTCGATNKSYWVITPICWFVTTRPLVNQSISFILYWRLSFIHLQLSNRLTLSHHFLFFYSFIPFIVLRLPYLCIILPLTSEHAHTHPFRSSCNQRYLQPLRHGRLCLGIHQGMVTSPNMNNLLYELTSGGMQDVPQSQMFIWMWNADLYPRQWISGIGKAKATLIQHGNNANSGAIIIADVKHTMPSSTLPPADISFLQPTRIASRARWIIWNSTSHRLASKPKQLLSPYM